MKVYNRHTYWAGLFRLPIPMENQVSTDNLGTVGPIWLILLTDPLEIKKSAQEWIYQPSKTWVCAGAQLLHDAQSTIWLILAYFGQNMLFMWFFFFVWKFLALAGIEKRQRGHIWTKNSCEFTPMKNAKKTVWNFLSFEALQPVHNCWCAACLVIRQDGNLFYWSWFQSLSRSTLVTHKLTHSQLMLSMLSKR